MVKKGGAVQKLIGFLMWLTGVIVALAVAFGIIGGTLTVPYIGQSVAFFGWIVVITTILGVILAIANSLK